ncbi:hypothetical protein P8C59_004099 [Phyllachora maydis]|uniref:Zn(2)-C6 fungal-type domain-containing protein n=1 Tax=Phyllachora maydis TaxID=1825666 RepID=A0AAD9MA14_9PEZI|nr:hypothetical protein P8C59_004099 [Phyllachora maydis]
MWVVGQTGGIGKYTDKEKIRGFASSYSGSIVKWNAIPHESGWGQDTCLYPYGADTQELPEHVLQCSTQSDGDMISRNHEQFRTPVSAGPPEVMPVKDALGPKIWTGTHFLPRFVRQAEVPGEGLCYFYDDGSYCKTIIEGEQVNAHWGVTKAGKPRKRLAVACVTCREKKIKCDPDYPRCVQCEKFGRVCKYQSAPRGAGDMNFPGKPLAQLLGAHGPVHAVSYSASPGTYILTGSADRSIRLYNPSAPAVSGSEPEGSIPEGRLIQTYAAHGYEVLSLAVAGDNARFASAGGDRSVFLWDVATAQTTRRFAGHGSRVNSVAFGGADDALVVSGGFDTAVRIWDAKSGGPTPVMALTDARDAVSSVAVAGVEVVAASVDGRVRSYDVRMGRVTTDVVGASVTAVCLARDAKTALVAALDSKLRLMDRARGTCLQTYEHPGWRNEELRVQAVMGGKESFVVAGDELTAGENEEADKSEGGGKNMGKIWAWDLLTGKLVSTLRVPWGPAGSGAQKKVVGRDGREKERKNIVTCLAWRDGGFGNQFCAGGTSGNVMVFGSASSP